MVTMHPSLMTTLFMHTRPCAWLLLRRRTECYQCSTVRPANPRRAVGDASADAPTTVIKVSGVEPFTK